MLVKGNKHKLNQTLLPVNTKIGTDMNHDASHTRISELMGISSVTSYLRLILT